MNRQRRILIMDDSEAWCDMLKIALEPARYHVDVAGTVAETLEKLDKSFYHVLTLDINMEDDAPDPDNVEGMELLPQLQKMGITSMTKIIMISGYGTMPLMREAFADYGVRDFLDKHEFDNVEFLERVDNIFDNELKINFGLEIVWQRRDINEAVTGLWLGATRLKQSVEFKKRIILEFDDLLCRLFYRAESILVRPLSRGMSGTRVLHVEPFINGSRQPVVVKYGEAEKIDTEFENYEEYIKGLVAGNRATSVLRRCRTVNLGGIIYSFMGIQGKPLRDFRRYYRDETVQEASRFLTRLFYGTCGIWYANRERPTPYNLTEHYLGFLNCTYARMRSGFEELENVHGWRRLYFNNLSNSRAFENPIAILEAQEDIIRSAYKCVTHGDMNASNIFVGEMGEAWLIDFLRTGPGHIWRDIAELDSVIRIELLDSEQVSLDERLELEERLLSVNQFQQLDTLDSIFSTNNPEIEKTFKIIIHLRKIAYQIAGQNMNDDMSNYYIALTYLALNMIRFSTLPTIQREHALLSASLLVGKLNL